jgi:hypothetical protein
MSNTITGPGTKKETVYSGPGPQAKQTPNAGSYNGMPPGTTGTMYNGPASGGTVYNGPGTGGTVYGGPAAGTVYNPRQAAPRPAFSAEPGPAATKGSNFFFAIAIFTVFRTLLIFSGATTLVGSGVTTSKVASQGAMTATLVVNVVIIGIFVLLGIAARSGSKAAFIIGMVISGADTALLLLSGHPELHVAGIVFHIIFLFGLFHAFRQL